MIKLRIYLNANVTNAHLHSFRVAKLEILAQDTQAALGDATGFFCEFRDHTFLVTNWHVVSGRHHQTKIPLHRSQALPGSLKVHTHIAKAVVPRTVPSSSTVFQMSLLDDAGDRCWLEHPLFGCDVDVIAIHIDSRGSDRNEFCRIDLESELARDTQLVVMDQAFVTGYPLSATTTPNSLPIYKSGTIASEPDVFDSVPRIYIDGKTKTGMSGSPVMVKRRAQPEEVGDLRGTAANTLDFIGVYSGRDRQEQTEFEAELGIVWPYKECLIPIIESFFGAETVPHDATKELSRGGR
ncbi:MAG: trypsin-like peptidase domain-containing protein [Gammaproteobacteria bacterium]|nr:trypsin-like peptidase domain-containing protein [Gammaproteobacteria bacterium]